VVGVVEFAAVVVEFVVVVAAAAAVAWEEIGPVHHFEPSPLFAELHSLHLEKLPPTQTSPHALQEWQEADLLCLHIYSS